GGNRCRWTFVRSFIELDDWLGNVPDWYYGSTSCVCGRDDTFCVVPYLGFSALRETAVECSARVYGDVRRSCSGAWIVDACAGIACGDFLGLARLQTPGLFDVDVSDEPVCGFWPASRRNELSKAGYH